MEANKFMDDFEVNIPLCCAGEACTWSPAKDVIIGTYSLYVQEWNRT